MEELIMMNENTSSSCDELSSSSRSSCSRPLLVPSFALLPVLLSPLAAISVMLPVSAAPATPLPTAPPSPVAAAAAAAAAAASASALRFASSSSKYLLLSVDIGEQHPNERVREGEGNKSNKQEGESVVIGSGQDGWESNRPAYYRPSRVNY
uniref:Uncharacterized protein n=1 Tax=Anopheles melas TaxID=34690 RepID=A0A182UJE3_9DIPT